MDTVVERAAAKKGTLGIVIALMAGYSMVYMDKYMISTAVIPLAQQFGLDAGQKGLIMSFFFLGYSIMQIPGGWLADRVGAKKVLMLSLGIITVFAFAFGAVSSMMLFFAIRFFAGVGHGGYPPSVTKAVATNIPQEKKTLIQSVIISTSGIGSILAFTIGANIINMNWRYGYICLGTLFLISLILVAIFVPKDVISKKESKEPKIPFKLVISDHKVIVLFIAMLLLNILLYGNISWLPTVLTQKFSLDLSQAGYLLTINAVFQTISTLLAGVLLSKLFLNRERMFILGATVISALLVIAFVLSDNLILSMVFLILVSMISISAFTAIFTFPHKIIDKSVVGSSLGIINTGGTLGGFISPLILGQLITMSGGSFVSSFAFMAGSCLLSGLIVIFGLKKGEA